MSQNFIEILNRVSPDILEYKGENLVNDGIIGSLDVMSLVSEIEEAYDVEFDPDDIIPENFASAQTIWELVERLTA